MRVRNWNLDIISTSSSGGLAVGGGFFVAFLRFFFFFGLRPSGRRAPGGASMTNSSWSSRAGTGGDAGSLTLRCSATIIRCICTRGRTDSFVPPSTHPPSLPSSPTPLPTSPHTHPSRPPHSPCSRLFVPSNSSGPISVFKFRLLLVRDSLLTCQNYKGDFCKFLLRALREKRRKQRREERDRERMRYSAEAWKKCTNVPREILPRLFALGSGQYFLELLVPGACRLRCTGKLDPSGKRLQVGLPCSVECLAPP